MRIFYLTIISILFFSCNNNDKHTPIPKSSLLELTYPDGQGHSGNEETGVLGYGYDASGLCDTLSVKARVLEIEDANLQRFQFPRQAGMEPVIAAFDYNNFCNKAEIIYGSSNSLLPHVNKLLKLALNNESIVDTCAYAYYSSGYTFSSFSYLATMGELKQGLSAGFVNDVNLLDAHMIVEKYGTHAIVDAQVGAKFEVIYKCSLKPEDVKEQRGELEVYLMDEDDLKALLYARMNEFFGGVPYVLEYSEGADCIPENEQLIFNTIGYTRKNFGVIYATDNNSDNISVDLGEVSDESDYQFIKVGEDGLIPLYDLVDDVAKKQELKSYIESFLE